MKIIALISIWAFFISSSTFSTERKDHVGYWKSNSEEEPAILHLSDSGYFEVIEANDTLGGPGINILDGDSVITSYTVDYSKTPYQIDLKVEVVNLNEVELLKGIFKFVNEDEIIICIADERPTVFEGEDCLTFTKVK